MVSGGIPRCHHQIWARLGPSMYATGRGIYIIPLLAPTEQAQSHESEGSWTWYVPWSFETALAEER